MSRDCNSFHGVVAPLGQNDTLTVRRQRGIIFVKTVSRGAEISDCACSPIVGSEKSKTNFHGAPHRGDTMQYEVEWIASVPEDEHGDADIDNAKYVYRRFPTKPLAEAFARKVIVGLPFEVAYIRPVREVSFAEIDNADSDLTDWWQEGHRFFGYVGDAVEVSS